MFTTELENEAWENIKSTGIASIDGKQLNANFLKQILLDDERIKEIPRQKLTIERAIFNEEINLESANLKCDLYFSKCEFKKKIKLNGLQTTRSLSFEGSTFRKNLEMKNSRIRGFLIFNNLNRRVSNTVTQIDLSYSTIDGCLELRKARLTKVRMLFLVK